MSEQLLEQEVQNGQEEVTDGTIEVSVSSPSKGIQPFSFTLNFGATLAEKVERIGESVVNKLCERMIRTDARNKAAASLTDGDTQEAVLAEMQTWTPGVIAQREKGETLKGLKSKLASFASAEEKRAYLREMGLID